VRCRGIARAQPARGGAHSPAALPNAASLSPAALEDPEEAAADSALSRKAAPRRGGLSAQRGGPGRARLQRHSHSPVLLLYKTLLVRPLFSRECSLVSRSSSSGLFCFFLARNQAQTHSTFLALVCVRSRACSRSLRFCLLLCFVLSWQIPSRGSRMRLPPKVRQSRRSLSTVPLVVPELQARLF